jgi:hypothetical protein
MTLTIQQEHGAVKCFNNRCVIQFMEEMKLEYKILIRKSEWKRPPETPT